MTDRDYMAIGGIAFCCLVFGLWLLLLWATRSTPDDDYGTGEYLPEEPNSYWVLTDTGPPVC